MLKDNTNILRGSVLQRKMKKHYNMMETNCNSINDNTKKNRSY